MVHARARQLLEVFGRAGGAGAAHTVGESAAEVEAALGRAPTSPERARRAQLQTQGPREAALGFEAEEAALPPYDFRPK
eukprot:1088300-Prymnesium_polylepis.1